jgi:hypothetical protein
MATLASSRVNSSSLKMFHQGPRLIASFGSLGFQSPDSL